jgi:hypothetical protein
VLPVILPTPAHTEYARGRDGEVRKEGKEKERGREGGREKERESARNPFYIQLLQNARPGILQ